MLTPRALRQSPDDTQHGTKRLVCPAAYQTTRPCLCDILIPQFMITCQSKLRMDEDAWLFEALDGVGDFELISAEEGAEARRSFGDAAELSAIWIEYESIASPTIPAASSAIVVTPPTTTTPTSYADSPLGLQNGGASPIKRADRGREKTKNWSRCARRDEISRLRQLVKELEQRRTELTTRATAASRDCGTTAGNSELRAAWQYVATRQAAQRERAQAENATLRDKLEKQLRLRNSLERVLQRSQPMLEKMLSIESRMSPPRSIHLRGDGQIFSQLMDRIESAFLHKNTVLAKHIHNHECNADSHEDVRLAHDSEIGLHVKTSDCRLFPFGYSITAQELWAAQPQIPPIRVEAYECIGRSDTHVLARYRVPTSSVEFDDIEIFTVSRRYFEANRTAIVVSAGIVCRAISSNDIDDICIHHTGWTVAESTTKLDSTTSHSATTIRTYTISVPNASAYKSGESGGVCSLVNFLVTSLSRDFSSRHHSLENRLLGQAVKPVRCPETR